MELGKHQSVLVSLIKGPNEQTERKKNACLRLKLTRFKRDVKKTKRMKLQAEINFY